MSAKVLRAAPAELLLRCDPGRRESAPGTFDTKRPDTILCPPWTIGKYAYRSPEPETLKRMPELAARHSPAMASSLD